MGNRTLKELMLVKPTWWGFAPRVMVSPCEARRLNEAGAEVINASSGLVRLQNYLYKDHLFTWTGSLGEEPPVTPFEFPKFVPVMDDLRAGK